MVLVLSNSGYLTITQSNFSKNSATLGAAIYLYNSKSNCLLEITDSTFTEHISTKNGGAICMTNFGNTSIIRCNFSKNFAGFGGAMILTTSQSNSFLEFTDCVFSENNSTSSGGAIYMGQLKNRILIRSNFSKNLASNGGAFVLFDAQPNFFLEVLDCLFIENNSTSSSGGGGAFYIQNFRDMSIIRNTFSRNTAGFGGAVYLSTQQVNSILNIKDCVIIENNSTIYGALYLKIYGNTSIYNNTFLHNSASEGAGIYLENSQSASMIEFIDCVFIENNSTSDASAFYMEGYENTLIIRNFFSKNIGGAINLFNSHSNSDLEINDCIFIENEKSKSKGGAIYMEGLGNTSIIRSNFSKNFANFGAAIYSSKPSKFIIHAKFIFYSITTENLNLFVKYICFHLKTNLILIIIYKLINSLLTPTFLLTILLLKMAWRFILNIHQT